MMKKIAKETVSTINGTVNGTMADEIILLSSLPERTVLAFILLIILSNTDKVENESIILHLSK